jgi:hypothetical protein
MKYRIKEVTRGNESTFIIQTKFLFWWIDGNNEYMSYIAALDVIEKLTKVSIKYHEVDINNLGLKVKFVDENGTEIPCPLTIPKSN